MLPTGQAREVIDGIKITCMEMAMPMMIARGEMMVPVSVVAHPVK
jgi:2-methylaconitate cis-trans-isomerase PrpF